MKAARGFTLGEVMIAIVLIAIAVLGLVGVRIHAIRASSASPDKQTASLIAVSKISEAEEALRLGQTPEQVTEAESQHPDYPRFRYSVTAKNSSYPNLVEVGVVVTWRDKERTGEYKLYTRVNRI